MKKMVIVFAIGFIASWQLKGNMSLTADNHVHVMSWNFPVPAVVQSTPYYFAVSNMIATPAPAAPQASAYAPRSNAGVAAPPPLPVVSAAGGSTYNGNGLSGAPAGSIQGQFDTTAKAIGGR
jgi:hypothetical protein